MESIGAILLGGLEVLVRRRMESIGAPGFVIAALNVTSSTICCRNAHCGAILVMGPFHVPALRIKLPARPTPCGIWNRRLVFRAMGLPRNRMARQLWAILLNHIRFGAPVLAYG